MYYVELCESAEGRIRMEKLAPLIMCVFIALIAFGLMKLALKISSSVTKKKILSYSRPSVDAASAYLCACFGEGNVLSGVWLPRLDRLGRKMYCDISVVPSGIYIVNISDMMGKIYCDDEYLWHRAVRTRSGELKENDFESPIIQNEKFSDSLSVLLKNENLPAYKITCITIFTSEKNIFEGKPDSVFTLADGAEYIKSQKSKKPLSKKERATIIRAIRKNSTKASHARAYNRKNGVG